MTLEQPSEELAIFGGVVVAAAVGVHVFMWMGGTGWSPWITAGLLAVYFGPTFALAPAAVEVDDDEVRVCRRLWWPLRIARTAIVRVERGPAITPTNTMPAPFQVIAPGIFGTFGQVSVARFGRVRGYITRTGPSLVLRCRAGLPVLITPDDPGALESALS